MSGFESNGGQNVIFYNGIEWESTDFNCTGRIYVRNIFQITDEMCFSIVSHLCNILLVLSFLSFLIACGPSSVCLVLSVCLSVIRLLRPWVKGFKFVQMKGSGLFKVGNNYEIAKNTLTKFKNLLLQNH